MFQLESYQLDGYVRWCKRHRSRAFDWPVGIGLLDGTAQLIAWKVIRSYGETPKRVAIGVLLALFVCASLLYYRDLHDKKERRPFKLTARMKRLYAAVVALLALAVSALYFARAPYYAVATLSALPLAAGWLIQPLETLINRRYADQARAKLHARGDLIKIGITGSYGKTSTKVILATILSEKYNVLASRESFNTPMGLTRVIREQLSDGHQVFIAEMGARHAGDIRELVELVHPKIGILTSVGPQHLETFGDVATVANTKFELIEGLPPDGVGFFGADSGEVDKLFERARCDKYRAGIEGGNLYARAVNVELMPLSSRFELVDAQGNSIRCETSLLGLHSIQNIAMSAAVALKLGLSMEEIARGVRKLKPIENRLQVMDGVNGMVILNDGYNANPAGACAALEALSRFEGRRRIIVTPGMVELGEREADFNREFGKNIAGCCDIAILVGEKRTEPISAGLREAGMPEEGIYVVSELGEVTELLRRIGRERDVVLFENDLADNHM